MFLYLFSVTVFIFFRIWIFHSAETRWQKSEACPHSLYSFRQTIAYFINNKSTSGLQNSSDTLFLMIHKKYILEAISFCQEGEGGQYVFPFLLLLGLHCLSFILTCSQSLALQSDASRESHNFPDGGRKKTYFGTLGSYKLLVHIILQSYDYLNWVGSFHLFSHCILVFCFCLLAK